MPSSQGNKLTAQEFADLLRQLNITFKDVYSKLDAALQLDGKGVIIKLTYGGLGKDVSGFSGFVYITGGATAQITVGTGLEISSNVLQLKAEAHEADPVALTSFTASAGSDHVDIADLNTKIGVLLTELEAQRVVITNILSKLESLGAFASS